MCIRDSSVESSDEGNRLLIGRLGLDAKNSTGRQGKFRLVHGVEVEVSDSTLRQLPALLSGDGGRYQLVDLGGIFQAFK